MRFFFFLKKAVKIASAPGILPKAVVGAGASGKNSKKTKNSTLKLFPGRGRGANRKRPEK